MPELKRHGLMDLDGLRAEYRDAVSTFPFALPEGYAFPAESQSGESLRGSVWEVGAGHAEAYCFWQASMVTAAYEADLAHDSAKADGLLRALEAGYDSQTRRVVLEDPGNYFVEHALEGATSAGSDTQSNSVESDFAPLLVFAGAVS
ncbi:hypothetical protein [Microbacterium sp. Leaf179]|uniref:hypothetical protein n=1 Tax=Microbacterium sp. Leaf179 TaxID=1736288 RepID=UPI0012E37E6A|nr:hypothetical protein [Microbacterium sp. Leaf179]